MDTNETKDAESLSVGEEVTVDTSKTASENTVSGFSHIASKASSAACAVLPILVGALAILSGFNCEINSKYLNTSGEVILTAASLLAVCLPLLCLLFLREKGGVELSRGAKWFPVLPAGASLALTIYLILTDIGEWGNATLLLSLAAAVFFVLKLFKGNDAVKLFCAFFALAFGTVIIAMLYLDFNIELNSPFKLAVQFGAVGLILGTVADARVILSRIGRGWFVILKSIASSLCLLCSGLIFTAFNRGFTVLPEIYRIFTVIYICYAISSLAEIIFLSRRSNQ